ncbi:MAG: cupin domain-containing protein [bacterium]|nr:cupin domain-containing protein [Gammaproteobacteria bacterium]HIL95983.1 cupin domain-containing protein [Pseudomonadales bacterium]
MKAHNVTAISDGFSTLAKRANESLGSFDESLIGMGMYVPGSSPWEKHNKGDELLYVTDGEVRIEVLEDSGESLIEHLMEGSLFVVPRCKWHQLTATDNVNILYISPSEDSVKRQPEHPIEKRDT